MEDYDEQTLEKVRRALRDRHCMTEAQITDAISDMQSQGILFRERSTDGPMHAIHTGGERWLKKRRNECRGNSTVYYALDGLLDEWREAGHTDRGFPWVGMDDD